MRPGYSSFRSTVLTAAVFLVLGGCGGADGGAEPEVTGPAGGAVTLWTDSTELFMEHPALIVGAPDKFAVHLTDLTDFAPLRSGSITLRFEPQDGGEPVIVTQDAPRAPGIYGPSPAFSRPGLYDLTITVNSPQAKDVIRVPGLQVYPTADEAPREPEAAEGGIAFLKEQQWKTPGFITAFASTGRVAESFQATGTIAPTAGRLARLSAPVAGMVEVSGVAQSPVPGQRVTRGQILVILTPALSEGGSSVAQARAGLREAEDEYARAQRLHAVEAIPARRLREAEIRLTAAQETLAAFSNSGALGPDGRLVLRSPIDGVVASRTLTPGSRVEAGAELITVVDPSVVWLVVNVPAGEAARVGREAGASFRVPGSVRMHGTSRIVSLGTVIDSISRTVPVIYEVRNADGAMRIGMNAQVTVGTSQSISGVVIPSSAVLDEDGQPVAYVQVEGERFERRALSLGGATSTSTLVRSGIAIGERVVTGAGYQIRLASLSTGVPTHGHEH